MVGKKNTSMKQRYGAQRQNHFGIRKIGLVVGSVVLGTWLQFGGLTTVEAAEIRPASEESGQVFSTSSLGQDEEAVVSASRPATPSQDQEESTAAEEGISAGAEILAPEQAEEGLTSDRAAEPLETEEDFDAGERETRPEAVEKETAKEEESALTLTRKDEEPAQVEAPDIDDHEAAKPMTEAAVPLQITEVLPDSDNISGSDAYEFIEIANTTNQDIAFDDYELAYCYPDSKTSTIWPASPANITIPAGDTLVFWIKNGLNDELTAKDFNAYFNTALTMGRELVEIYSAGLANSGARGLEIRTKTGLPINRIFYNLKGKEVVKNRAFQYGPTPGKPLEQSLLGLAQPSPGSLIPEQKLTELATLPANQAEPVIQDETPAKFSAKEPFHFSFTVTDDWQPLAVTLSLTSSGAEGVQHYHLKQEGEDHFSWTLPPVDLLGKQWLSYQLAVSDGEHIVTTEPKRLQAMDQAGPLALNLSDQQWVRGQIDVIGSSWNFKDQLALQLDGQSLATTPSLATNPVFAMEASGVNDFFQNGILVGQEVLHIFDHGTGEGWQTLPFEIPQKYLTADGRLVVSVYAGTKQFPGIDPKENNDDFDIQNMRLILPDGRTLYPENIQDPKAVMAMGDSAGKHDYYDFIFQLPADANKGERHALDTTGLTDGWHQLTVRNQDGSTLTQSIRVDNTAPVIQPSISEGALMKGAFTLAAQVTDAGIGVEQVTHFLDGEKIAAEFPTSSTQLSAGNHTYQVIAEDGLGNRSQVSVNFRIPVENPSVSALTPHDGAEGASDAVDLTATVHDATNDEMTAIFKEGYPVLPTGDDFSFASGVVHDSLAVEREDPTKLTAPEGQALQQADQAGLTTTATEGLPYQIFKVKVKDTTGENARVRVRWQGEANGQAQIRLFALNPKQKTWQEVAQHSTAKTPAGARESFTLTAEVPTDQYAENGEVTFLVQHSLGWAGPAWTKRTDQIQPNHPEDRPRDQYDFTLAWETDTQYYNETEAFHKHQVNIHNFLLKQRKNMNIQYLIHSGDIVNVYDQAYQWANADQQYARLDAADFPYGVLAGNHDVGHHEADYTYYGEHFGAERYQNKPWYGESYANNRGHYDLISAGGLDLMIMYMGWDVQEEQIAWMNDALAKHPDRQAILVFHEFLQTTGGLGKQPQAIMDEVVAKNPNVKMVLSGHYHDTITRTDTFDDDGDGRADRTVTSMLFDYQSLDEGGLGYLRLFHFDHKNQQLVVRTYSESLKDYNADDPTFADEDGNLLTYQDFTIPYAQLGFQPQEKILHADAIQVDVLTDKVIGQVDGLHEGDLARVTWSPIKGGTQGWYVTVTDDFGGHYDSPVQVFKQKKIEKPAAGSGQVEVTDEGEKEEPTWPTEGEAGQTSTGSSQVDEDSEEIHPARPSEDQEAGESSPGEPTSPNKDAQVANGDQSSEQSIAGQADGNSQAISKLEEVEQPGLAEASNDQHGGQKELPVVSTKKKIKSGASVSKQTLPQTGISSAFLAGLGNLLVGLGLTLASKRKKVRK